MPSTRPCAAFEPISPDLDLKNLVETTPNFEWVTRVHCDMIDLHGLDNFDRLVLMHVIMGGKPLVLEGYDTKLDKWIFALQWLRDNCGSKVVDARDLTKQVNLPLSIGHYLNHMALLTNQWTPNNFKDNGRQRMYLKDIDCPDMWHEKMKGLIPPTVFYLNETTANVGGSASVDGSKSHSSAVAKAGDLMSSLPKEMRAENLMCYIGHEGTYTPAHREMCASLGHNIMVEASNGSVEDGKPTKPGSSIWFMTETAEREVVSEYWLSRLGHDIEVEKHFAQVNAWKTAPFKVWVVEQKPGDFILIPPLAPHQVWNRGTRTMKVAWNRTTVETLEMALNEALPKARMVCRDEQYKNKAIIYYTLQKYSDSLTRAEQFRQRKPDSKRAEKAKNKIMQLAKDFKRLHAMFTKIMVSESFFAHETAKKVEMVPYEGFITCSYCRCNIFNRFLTCPSCVVDLPEDDKDTYDVCLDCYAMGRSCACISKLKWAEQWQWSDLVQQHDQWRHQIVQIEGSVNESSPKLLQTELDRLGKRRTLAQICQLELIKRPFKDIRKPEKPVDKNEHLEEDVQVDENGNVKKKRPRKSEKFVRDHARCHIDCYWEPKWKQATCTKCDKNYCYGTLFRAYDMMPQDIMANPEWECPSCLRICHCRSCRNKPGYRKYTPKGTLLGHNTKAVADARSVESLVDFSFSNISWIQKAGDDRDSKDTERLRKKRRDAAAAMAEQSQLGADYVDSEAAGEDVDASILRLAEQEGIPIDPALVAGLQPGTPDEDAVNENPEDAANNAILSGSSSSPVFLPEGGVIQDAEHAYEINDAVTFVYPEPSFLGTQLPPVPEEGYKEAPTESNPSYGIMQPLENPGTIEMVERKRKRHTADPSDQTYQQKKSYPKKAPKKRQSLVVKLAIPKNRLQDFQRIIPASQPDTNLVAAPTIGSDLQALNVYPSQDIAPEKKRQRIDHTEVEDVDTEYAPGRRRDRRKQGVDENTLTVPDADSVRRVTRTHNVRYDEPDEDEFDEVVDSRVKEQSAQLSAQVQKKQVAETVDISDVEMESDIEEKQARNLPVTVPKKLEEQPQQPRQRSDSAQVPDSSAKIIAQAVANRRAKMAAIEGNDIAAFDDSWSADESLPTPEEIVESMPEERGGEYNSSAASVSSQTNIAISASKVSAQAPKTSVATFRRKAREQSMSTSSRSASPIAKPVTKVKAVSAVKASANDWGQSDSSDEDAPRRPNPVTNGFSAINAGIGNHAVAQNRIGNHVLPSKRGRGRARGRPRARG